MKIGWLILLFLIASDASASCSDFLLSDVDVLDAKIQLRYVRSEPMKVLAKQAILKSIQDTQKFHHIDAISDIVSVQVTFYSAFDVGRDTFRTTVRTRHGHRLTYLDEYAENGVSQSHYVDMGQTAHNFRLAPITKTEPLTLPFGEQLLVEKTLPAEAWGNSAIVSGLGAALSATLLEAYPDIVRAHAIKHRDLSAAIKYIRIKLVERQKKESRYLVSILTTRSYLLEYQVAVPSSAGAKEDRVHFVGITGIQQNYPVSAYAEF